MNFKSFFWSCFALLMILGVSSCSTSNDVVGNGLFQKRKYQPGFHFTGFNPTKSKKSSLVVSESRHEPRKEKLERMELARIPQTLHPNELVAANESGLKKLRIGYFDRKLDAKIVPPKLNNKRINHKLTYRSFYGDGIEPEKEGSASSARGRKALWLAILSNALPILAWTVSGSLATPILIFVAYGIGLFLAIAALIMASPLRKEEKAAKDAYLLSWVLLVQVFAIALIALFALLVVALFAW